MELRKSKTYIVSERELKEAIRRYLKAKKIKLNKDSNIEIKDFTSGFSAGFSFDDTLSTPGAEIIATNKSKVIKGVGSDITLRTITVPEKILRKAVIKYLKHKGFKFKARDLKFKSGGFNTNTAVEITVTKDAGQVK